MKGIPERIWLQVDPGREAPEVFDREGVTWCEDRIDSSDIEYVRVDQIPKSD